MSKNLMAPEGRYQPQIQVELFDEIVEMEIA
jgi:hypothetical protein